MPPKTGESRPLNAIEQRIHQACLSSGKALTQKEIDALVPVADERVKAINFLLGVGALKMMQDASNVLSYKAISKKELEIKKEMSGDENMVLSHIQAAGNQGIWTKHLKAKTELHQTVITRCLKSLEQKGLIKAVSAVKYPTRKIYMMSHLDPSVELTGGPWYSENELDTEFINALTGAILRFIQDKSFPKTHKTDTPTAAPLFPISHSSSYPTAKMIHGWLHKSRLSEQELGVEHVEMLLDVLVYDGHVERLPAYGASMWDMSAMDDDSDKGEKDKKRKKKESGKKSKSKKSKKRSSRNDDSSDEESEDDARKKRKRKRKEESEGEQPKKKRKKKEESDLSDGEKRKEKKKNRRRRHESEEDDSDSSSESEDDRKKKSRKKSKSSRSKSKKRSRYSTSESESDSDSSSSDSDSESESESSHRKKKRGSSKSSSKRARLKSKAKSLFDVDSDDAGGLKTADFANVYRAIRQECVSLGLSQAPCCRCPVFDFCSDKGPVNPKQCTYYGDWLQQGIAEF